jgi:hypothetical protein
MGGLYPGAGYFGQYTFGLVSVFPPVGHETRIVGFDVFASAAAGLDARAALTAGVDVSQSLGAGIDAFASLPAGLDDVL